MARVLITGMSGVGKSTVVTAVAEAGHPSVDTDYGNWKNVSGDWDIARVGRLLDEHEVLLIAGTVENQGLLHDRFDHVVLLSLPPSVRIERLRGAR